MTDAQPPARAHLLGAEGARELIDFLTGEDPHTEISRRATAGQPMTSLRLHRVVRREKTVLERHLLTYEAEPLTMARPVTVFAPDRTLVIIGADVEIAPATLPEDTVILQVAAGCWSLTAAGRSHSLPDDEDAIIAALAQVAPLHVRVIADLGPVENWLAEQTSPDDLLSLHDAAFLAAKAATAPVSYYVLALRGADETGLPHPYAGLFTGLLKALEVEPQFAGVDCLTLLSSERAVTAAIGHLELESRGLRVLPAVVYAAGQRWVPRTRPAALDPAAAGPALPAEAVVVGAGASRGVGMAMLEALAERYQPVIHVLGSNDLDAYNPEALSESDTEHRERRRRRLLAGASNGQQGGIAQVNAELRRLAHARQVHAGLRRLEALCGPGRVNYHVCDMLDATAVRLTVEAIQETIGERQVDLLLNLAGINRSAELGNKRLADFRAVRDVKVAAYRHLKAAFAARPPRRWANTSSIAAIMGMRGETDYAAGNDFLFTAGSHAVAGGADEITFGWGLWKGVGRAAEAFFDRVLEDNGDMAQMPVSEGITHLLTELGQPRPGINPVYFGDTERKAGSRSRPHLADLWEARPNTRTARRFFLDAIVEQDPTHLVAHRDFTLDRDGYLEDHLIQGHPTLPGLLFTEMAAQAAAELVPGRIPVALEDLAFERFLRVYLSTARAEHKKIVAELVRHDPGPDGESLVDVRILCDIIAPDGTVLATDKLHARMRVILRDTAPACPRPTPEQLPDTTGAAPVPNPYRNNPFARLTGIFASADTILAGARGNQAVMRLQGPRLSRWFADACLPSVLCDAAAQVGVATAGRAWNAIVIPRAIGRVDLYGGLNDHVLVGRDLTLLATAPHEAARNVTAHWGAVLDDEGQMVLRMLGMTGDIIGYAHSQTGEFRTLQEHAAHRQPTSPVAAPAVRLPSAPAEQEAAVRPHLLSYDGENYCRPVERMVAAPVPARQACPPAGYLTGRTVLLLGADAALTASVAAALREAGALIHAVTTDEQLTAVAGTAADWDGIIDLNLTGTAPYRLGDDHWRSALSRTVTAVNRVYKRWYDQSTVGRYFYLAVGHQDGLFGRAGGPFAQPVSGAWTGLAKSLPMELPTVAAKAIDLDTAESAAVAAAILREAGSWDDHEIGYRHGRRHTMTMRLAPLALPEGQEPAIGPDDCVLISGGGRGVGFALATALARTGASVVVTGRRELSEDVVTRSDSAQSTWRRDRLATAHQTPGGVRAVLRELEVAERQRTLHANLFQAARADLAVDYRACDITDRGQVEALLADLEHAPTVLIHNAAVYRGVRFSSYDEAEVIDTVSIKVAGFTNLLGAIMDSATADRPLRLVSCASSMSGRIGGMIGHVAYAAGNNALTQLGLWAAERHGVPVQTICWPTWERTGNIVNYLGAAQYGSTMLPAEGVAHWAAELAAQTTPGNRSGESTYFGRLGVVVRPGHLKACSWPDDQRDTARVQTLRRLLGEPRTYVDNSQFATRHRLITGSEPHLPAGGSLPVPMLLEYALAAGDWVRPQGIPRQHLAEIAELDVTLPGLRLPVGGELVLDLTATGTWAEEVWEVKVTVTGVATLILRYTADAPTIDPDPQGTSIPITPHADAALWCTPQYGHASLPHPALSAILRDVLSETTFDTHNRLTIRSMVPLPGCLATDSCHRTSRGYQLGTAGSSPLLSVEGICFAEAT
jgi:NAD(P)-dependent dehydrogenase (short-subunit alcohol dehydrogenase family)